MESWACNLAGRLHYGIRSGAGVLTAQAHGAGRAYFGYHGWCRQFVVRFDVCHIPPPYLYIRSRSLSLTLRRDTTSLREETQTNKHGRQSAAAVFRTFKSGAADNVTAAAATLIRTSRLPLFVIFQRFWRVRRFRVSLGILQRRGACFLTPSGRDRRKWAKAVRRRSGSGGGGKRAYGFSFSNLLAPSGG